MHVCVTELSCCTPETYSSVNQLRGFPGSSDGKESACIVGDLGSMLGSGRSPGVRKGNHSSILAWKSHGQRNLVGCCNPPGFSVHGVTESDTTII